MTSPANPTGSPVLSPCTSVCAIDPVTGLCVGCFRTLDEIAAWSLLDDDTKRDVWSTLAQRRTAAAIPVDSKKSPWTGADADR